MTSEDRYVRLLTPNRTTHFQMKTLKHVSTEKALHVLACNMKVVMCILGVGGSPHDGVPYAVVLLSAGVSTENSSANLNVRIPVLLVPALRQRHRRP